MATLRSEDQLSRATPVRTTPPTEDKMDAWDFPVDRKDLRRTNLARSATLRELAEGEALLEVESFALTANNVTYGVLGDAFGYWKFFPAPQGWGRIPVWGFARVIRSRAPGGPEGFRLFGYWPMSTHVVAQLKVTPAGVVDTTPHRTVLPPTYNAYSASTAEPGDDYQGADALKAIYGDVVEDRVRPDEGHIVRLRSALYHPPSGYKRTAMGHTRASSHVTSS